MGVFWRDFGIAFGEATYAAFLENAGLFFRVDSQGCPLGWYAMPRWGMGSNWVDQAVRGWEFCCFVVAPALGMVG